MCYVALFVTLLFSSVPVQTTINYWRLRPVYSSLYHANPFIQRAMPARQLRQLFIPTRMRIQQPLVVARRRIVSLSRPVSSVPVLFHHRPDFNFRRRNQIINSRIPRGVNSLEEIRRQRTAFVGRPSILPIDTNRATNTYQAAVRVPLITPQHIHSNGLPRRNRAFRSPLLAESVEERTSRRYLNRKIHFSSASELQVGDLSMNSNKTTNTGLTSAQTSSKAESSIVIQQVPNENAASGSPIVAEYIKQPTNKQFSDGRQGEGMLLNKNQATYKNNVAAQIPLKDTSNGQLKRLSYRNGALKSPIISESVEQESSISALNFKGHGNYNSMHYTQNTGDNASSETESTNSIVAAIIAGLNLLKHTNSNNNNMNSV